MDTSPPEPPTHPTPHGVPQPVIAGEPAGSFRAGVWTGLGVGCAASLVGAVLVGGGLAALGYWLDQAETKAAIAAATSTTVVAPDSADLDELAIQDALDAGEFDRAESLAAEHARQHPDDPDAQGLLQMVRIERAVAAEDTTAADALVREAVAKDLPVGAATIAGVAELWLQEGEPARALELADRAVKEAAPRAAGKPDEDEYDRYARGYALVVRGMARAEVGDPGAGIRDLEAAVELAPDEETAREWQAALEELREKAQ